MNLWAASLTRPESISVGTALATLVLAGVTAWMAWETRRVARNTDAQADAIRIETKAVRDQAVVTRSALEASIRPWITAKPDSDVYVSTSDERTRVLVPIANVGNGLALIKKPEGCRIIGHAPLGVEGHRRTGKAKASILPSGVETEIVFTIEHKPLGPEFSAFTGQPDILGEFKVEIDYTDATGGQATTARAKIANTSDHPAGDWSIVEMSYRPLGVDEPFAEVEFDSTRD